jgi:hypothetical protein
MKLRILGMAGMMWMSLGGVALAREAETDAWARSNNRGHGTAGADARYEGDVGFARTRAESGKLSFARGVSVGVDERGLSFSASNAWATRFGIAGAGNFNLSINRDGQVSVSGGRSVSAGPIHRSAQAGGFTAATGRQAIGISSASARSDRYGRAEARTFSRNSGPKRVIRKIRSWR